MINFNIEDGNRMIKQNKIIIVTKRNNKTLFRVIQFMKITRMSRDNMDCQHFFVQLLFGHICKTIFYWSHVFQSTVNTFIIVP